MFPPTAMVRSSWGCRMPCTFCVVPHLCGGVHQPRAVESVVEEIAGLQAGHVYFCDDENFIDDEFALALADGLARRGVKKRYFAWTRATTVNRSPDTLRRWREVGIKPTGPTLALNHAALVLLERDGARLEALDVPQFGRALASTAVPGGLLNALGAFNAGIHGTHRLPAAALPVGWTLAATGADGRVIAAVHPQRRIVALAFRPDALRSLQHDAGRRALLAALQWLAEVAA
jgi:hypothetical protein